MSSDETARRRRISGGDLIGLTLAVIAIVAGVGPAGIAEPALKVLIAVLIGWPVVMLAILAVRWTRAGDTRFVLIVLMLVTVTSAAIVGAMALSQ